MQAPKEAKVEPFIWCYPYPENFDFGKQMCLELYANFVLLNYPGKWKATNLRQVSCTPPSFWPKGGDSCPNDDRRTWFFEETSPTQGALGELESEGLEATTAPLKAGEEEKGGLYGRRPQGGWSEEVIHEECETRFIQRVRTLTSWILPL